MLLISITIISTNPQYYYSNRKLSTNHDGDDNIFKWRNYHGVLIRLKHKLWS